MNNQVKIVVFVPLTHADIVRQPTFKKGRYDTLLRL